MEMMQRSESASCGDERGENATRETFKLGRRVHLEVMLISENASRDTFQCGREVHLKK